MFSKILSGAALLGAASAGAIPASYPTTTYPSYPTTTATPTSGYPTSSGYPTPSPSPSPGPGYKFGVLSLRSASPIHFAQFQASQGNLFLYLPDQGAECDGQQDVQYATFYIEDGELFLYSKTGEVQQIYVDRSGMGQGKTGYITGEQSPPRNAELKGWGIDEYDDLYFDDATFLACPNSIEDSWSLWINAGVANPGGNEGCLGLTGRTTPISNPSSCEYSQ